MNFHCELIQHLEKLLNLSYNFLHFAIPVFGQKCQNSVLVLELHEIPIFDVIIVFVGIGALLLRELHGVRDDRLFRDIPR